VTDKLEEMVWRTFVHHNLSRDLETHLLTIVCIASLPRPPHHMKMRISLVFNDILILHKDQILQLEILRFSKGTSIPNRLESILCLRPELRFIESPSLIPHF
jgi:hypothetical protein